MRSRVIYLGMRRYAVRTFSQVLYSAEVSSARCTLRPLYQRAALVYLRRQGARRALTRSTPLACTYFYGVTLGGIFRTVPVTHPSKRRRMSRAAPVQDRAVGRGVTAGA